MGKLSISKRGQSAPVSPIRGLVAYAQEAKARGIDIYHLNIGDPDFLLPKKIKETLLKVADSTNRIPYPEFRGNTKLLEGWKKYFSDIGISFLQNEDMLVTAGASDAMVLIAATLLDPEDEYIVFEPFYPPYMVYGKFVGANPVSVQLNKNYHLPSKEEIVAKITPKTKAIFFTNPNNPTGSVFTKDEIKIILEIAIEHNLFVVSDETYRGMVFDGRENLSTLAVATDEELKHIVVADSLSKRFNVCGARMGLVVSKNSEVIQSAFRFVQGRPFPAFLEQEIVAPMFGDSLNYINWLAKEYEKRRDTFIQTFEEETGIKVNQPEGAFYTMLKLPIKDTMDFSKWLLTDFNLENETVMVSPGFGFYLTAGKGMDEVRIAYVLNEEKLKKAARLLAMAIKKYQSIEGKI
ncbi:MAG TPA: pyridoxal phosphate-dependent aminotransferase [Patescibacteria group bacterium]